MTNWEKDSIHEVTFKFLLSHGLLSEQQSKAVVDDYKNFIKSQRLEVLRECLKGFVYPKPKWTRTQAKFLLEKLWLRNELTESEYEGLLKEFNL